MCQICLKRSSKLAMLLMLKLVLTSQENKMSSISVVLSQMTPARGKTQKKAILKRLRRTSHYVPRISTKINPLFLTDLRKCFEMFCMQKYWLTKLESFLNKKCFGEMRFSDKEKENFKGCWVAALLGGLYTEHVI